MSTQAMEIELKRKNLSIKIAVGGQNEAAVRQLFDALFEVAMGAASTRAPGPDYTVSAILRELRALALRIRIGDITLKELRGALDDMYQRHSQVVIDEQLLASAF